MAFTFRAPKIRAPSAIFITQTKALVKKTLLLHVRRKWMSTFLQAYFLPILVLTLCLSIQKISPQYQGYGVGEPAPVQSLHSSLLAVDKDFVIVADKHLGPDVAPVIDKITKPLADISHRVKLLQTTDEMNQQCTANLRGISNCHAALIFDDSPLTPGGYRTWNYTMRSGTSRLPGFNVHTHTGSEDTLWLPLQIAVDNAITNSTVTLNAYGYTSRSQEVMNNFARIGYMTLFISLLLITFFVGMLPIVYHAVNTITTDRDVGMSQLVDAMGGAAGARVTANVVALNLIYLPTWIIYGCLFWHYVFPESNAGVLIVWMILSGIAITNGAIFAAAFFNRRRISSVFVAVVFLALGVVAANQVDSKVTTGAVIAFSILFPGMNYLFCLARMARFAIGLSAIDIHTTESPPQPAYVEETYHAAVIVFWILLIIQIVVFPLLAVQVERLVHGISFRRRTLEEPGAANDSFVAVETSELKKVYAPAIWKKVFCWAGKSKTVTAVDGLKLVAHKNQILCLLGVNGSGKTTTLDLIGGLQHSTAGSVHINAPSTQLGICPQRNVMHPELTVLEHLKFWSDIKGGKEDAAALQQLLEACDLTAKASYRAGHLSGGQKRKLQLACMFVGGSTVCLMDEVTTGLDPLSRRVIWNIILAERSKRTMLFTTHFLDEGEVLADHIVLLSQGNIKCQGSGAELKNQFGGGYNVHVPRSSAADVDVGIPGTIHQDRVVYNTPDTKSAGRLIARLEAAGQTEVAMDGPTIERVFLRLTTDVDETLRKDLGGPTAADGLEKKVTSEPLERQLASGKQTSSFRQIFVLMRKRFTVLPRFWIAPLLALFIPCFIPSRLDKFLDRYEWPACDRVVNGRLETPREIQLYISSSSAVPFGPLAAKDSLVKVLEDHYPIITSWYNYSAANLDSEWAFQDSFDGFQSYLDGHRVEVFDGAIYMGDDSHPPTIAAHIEYGFQFAISMASFFTNVRTGIPIGVKWGTVSQLTTFGDNGSKGMFWVVFTMFVFSAFPAFFSLYPAFEKTHNIRALQYANGVRPFPLWLSHLLFDFIVILCAAMSITVTVYMQFGHFWFGPGWIFLVTCLYGLASILIVYLIARLARSQLSAFLFSFGVMMLLFTATVLAIALPQSFIDVDKLEQATDAISFSLGLFLPTVNMWKALSLGINLYKVTCRNNQQVTYPGSIYAYGGPILLLLIQIVFLTLLLVYLESNHSFAALSTFFARHRRSLRPNHPTVTEESRGEKGLAPPAPKTEILEETARVDAADATDLLRLSHLGKSFAGVPAVVDVSLGLGQGEILALLGPNGAGKTTIANLIMGELAPTTGSVHLKSVDVHRHTRAAQRALGVCPQFDALDLMTARQHLEFYARVRGVAEVGRNVEVIMQRIGLAPHADKAAAKLSGGNKRKLSLAIALIGNPDVLILDEPSSAMDAAAKRVMWRLLAEVAPGRSVLLTTHSMEEADALATRAAIIAKRLLAVGTSQQLRQRYSNLYCVTLVLATAPESSAAEMAGVERWVRARFAGVAFEGESLGGQVKFVVPSAAAAAAVAAPASSSSSEEERGERPVGGSRHCSIANIIETLEENREALGLADYNIGAPTLERVFLSVVKDNLVEEDEKKKRWWQF